MTKRNYEQFDIEYQGGERFQSNIPIQVWDPKTRHDLDEISYMCEVISNIYKESYEATRNPRYSESKRDNASSLVFVGALLLFIAFFPGLAFLLENNVWIGLAIFGVPLLVIFVSCGVAEFFSEKKRAQMFHDYYLDFLNLKTSLDFIIKTKQKRIMNTDVDKCVRTEFNHLKKKIGDCGLPKQVANKYAQLDLQFQDYDSSQIYSYYVAQKITPRTICDFYVAQ